MASETRRVLIVGAGLAGCLAACYLRKLGWAVEIVERRADPRKAGYAGGRSINLALSVRGIHGLAGVGLDKTVLDLDAIAMRGRMVHPPTSGGDHGAEPVLQPYSSDPKDAIYSVSRGGLNLTLIDAAERAGAVIAFDSPCVDVDLAGGEVVFQRGDGAGGGDGRAAVERFAVGADLILGCDGAFSPVRAALQKTERFDYQQFYLPHGYKELRIPPAAEVGVEFKRFDGWALDPHALHIWPRGIGGVNGGAMMIALPNRDRSFTCTLFWPLAGEHSFATLESDEAIRGFFARHYGDALPLMPTLVDDFRRNPVGSLVTVRCRPWQMDGRVAILGDAAHAIVPFYGQGMNCAFEDVRALADCLQRFGRDQRAALEEFERLRKPAADAVSELALDNFVEMRDKVGSRAFRWKKKAERQLHAAFPELFLPLYSMVSFSTIPYHEAVRRARRQGLIVRATLGLLLGAVLAAALAALQLGILAAAALGLVAGWWAADAALRRVEARWEGA